MAITLDIRRGLGSYDHYQAFKFPGGEIHFKLTEYFEEKLTADDDLFIIADCKTSDGILLLAIVAETIDKTWENEMHAYIPYMPYQQADRNFGNGECFSLKTICNLLNALPIKSYTVYDAHSDVTPALLRNCVVVDNSGFITAVLKKLEGLDNLTIMSPDAGAYKKIFKLAEKIGFTGAIETANKYRDTKDGTINLRLSADNFQRRNILIIDDICVGGRTFIELARTLNTKNAGFIYLAVSHGIFSNGLEELREQFDGIFTTNSRNQDYSSINIRDVLQVVQVV